MSHARSPYRFVVALAAVLVAGCQSGVERDIVQRELRQQEDQIYALEDYLSEYQQLLCDARTENVMLKRQLVQNQFREAEPSGPSGDEPPSPPEQPLTPPATEPEATPPGVPPLDLNEPAVPPLDATSADEPQEEASEIKLAVADMVSPPRSASSVVLRGEVRLDDAESGPRVLVGIEPLADSGEPAEFLGSLSLLVLDPAARSHQKQLARWDFAAKDLQPFANDAKPGTSFEFPLQLPAEVPTDRPVELWVRLVPEEGEKLLGRTTMDLSRSGCFASAEATPPAADRKEVRTASLDRPAKRRRNQTIHKTDTGVRQSGWQTARPGEVSTVTRAASESHSKWRTATQPIPLVESRPIAESTSIRTYLPPSTGQRYKVAAEPEAPAWSPDRSDNDAVKSPPIDHLVPPPGPAWAPTR